MDTLETMRLFVRIVERRSFSGAAADQGVPRSTATSAIQHLETRLGARLLDRTSRHVSPTLDGEAYYRRCVAILSDVEEAEDAVAGAAVRGLLRIDVNGFLARSVLLPRLPEFLERHPQLSLHIGEGDRFVDLIREGVDCVIRAGQIADSEMIVRRLGVMQEVTCASADYLARFGRPLAPDKLDGHQMVGFLSSRTGQVLPLEFTDGAAVREVVLPARVSTSSSETAAAMARLGLGLTQAPRHRFLADLDQGVMEEVLSQNRPTPTPLSLLYPQKRQLSPRVRAFAEWVVDILHPLLD